MTFDEAIEELRLVIPEKFYSPTLHDIAVMVESQIKVINTLRQQYAPTVEMTKKDKEMLLYYLENYSFYVFIDIVHTSKGDTFGLPANDDYNDLSDEDLMQAWLHPEIIKIVDDEED